MKKIIIFTLTLFSLFSCSDSLNSKEEKGIFKETSDITNDYVNTLTGSIKDAKDAKNLMENKDKELEKAIIDARK